MCRYPGEGIVNHGHGYYGDMVQAASAKIFLPNHRGPSLSAAPGGLSPHGELLAYSRFTSWF